MKDSKIVRRIAFAVVAALLVVPFATPGRAADDVNQTRSVSGFDRVSLNGAFKAEIVVGKSAHVVVSGSPDVVARVTTEVKDGTLVVGMRSGSSLFRSSPKIAIALPELRKFTNDGAGAATITGVTGGDFAIDNSGAATIKASGRATRETISLNGTGLIDASGVEARDATVDNNGLGSVRVRATESLVMNVNGVGEILYAGNPKHVENHINGIGRIKPL